MTIEEFLEQPWHPSTVTMTVNGFEAMIVADFLTIVITSNISDAGPVIQMRDEILLAHNAPVPRYLIFNVDKHQHDVELKDEYTEDDKWMADRGFNVIVDLRERKAYMGGVWKECNVR